MLHRKSSCLLTLVFALFQSASAGAEVMSSGPDGFNVRVVVKLDASAKDSYKSFIKKIGQWWNPDHTYFGEAEKLSLDARPGGCFCEKVDGDRGVQHMSIVFADPGKRLRMTGGLGQLQPMGVSASMNLEFSEKERAEDSEAAPETELELSYNVGGYHPDGLASLAAPVDRVLTDQMQRFQSYVNSP